MSAQSDLIKQAAELAKTRARRELFNSPATIGQLKAIEGLGLTFKGHTFGEAHRLLAEQKKDPFNKVITLRDLTSYK